MAALSKSKIVPLAVAGLTILAVAIGGALWWMDKQRFEGTDNAFVQADKVSVAPQVDGYVAEVLVGDNQTVAKDQVLVRIDDATLRADLAQAEANARSLEAAVRSVDDKAALEQAMIAQKEAALRSARAEAQLADAELARYAALSKENWVSPQRIQSVRAAASKAAASVAEAQATLQAERKTAEALGSMRAQNVAEAQAARAAVDKNRIDLSRTEIRAPVSGVVGARAVRLGQYVRAGAPLMSVVPLADTYVVANFKETQVARLRIGQPVEIRADAFGKQAIGGKIDSFAPATGSEFALIPVENAVGNFTKIAQRLPVRIAVNRDSPLGTALRPGLSVKVKVDVRADTGPSFAEAASPAAQLARRGAAR